MVFCIRFLQRSLIASFALFGLSLHAMDKPKNTMQVPSPLVEPIQTTRDMVPSVQNSKSRSSWALFGGIGHGIEAVEPIFSVRVLPTDPLGKNSPSAERAINLPGGGFNAFIARIGAMYYTMDTCQTRAGSTCLDPFVSTMVQYHVTSPSTVHSIQVLLHGGSDIYFGSQRRIAWTVKFGFGYSHSSYNDFLKNEYDLDVYYSYLSDLGFDAASSRQNRLLFYFSTGLQFNLPSVPGLGLYVQVEMVPALSISPLGAFTSIQFSLPVLGVVYRF